LPVPDPRPGGAADLAGAASVFAALGDQTRLRLAARLSDDGPLSITHLSAGLPMTRQGVTKHLCVLEEAGLVKSRAAGRERVWRLDGHRLAVARRHLERISAEWDQALGRLATFVERE
jgi:DNA-binding transcriptional ArsR family regulator